ncbi:MAG: hypothetical protein IPK82_16300 [Polyangiaceae bacterium]|nr:hypothetical protein [Polyangiaceae bacterium]
MKLSLAAILPFFTLFPALLTTSCGDSTTGTGGNGGNSTTSSTDGGSAGSPNGGSGGSGASGGSTSSSGGTNTGGSTTGTGGSTTTSSTTTTTGTGGSVAVLDPSKDGPYQVKTVDDSVTVGDHQVPIHCVYPVDGPTSGPYPVVVVGHGFQLPPSQYYKYLDRLATFGYVALTADFPTSFFGPDNPANAADMSAGLDWAESKLPGIANADLAGMTGHSLGGKVALLAATKDARVKASIVLDPVDGGGGPGGGCNPPGCVDVSALMPQLNIPTGFLGETTDAMGGFQPCAPAAENYTTFYAGANSPSFTVTIKGANHMSFLDDVASCGFTCNFCNMATLDNATVNGMSRAYVVAFYERYLRNNAGYDTYLTGAEAQALYVQTGIATIQSK